VVPVSFGNDSKRVGGSRGPNKTGRTDAERAQVRAYLRQGVDRYVEALVGWGGGVRCYFLVIFCKVRNSSPA
jgi:hypothetical protein